MVALDNLGDFPTPQKDQLLQHLNLMVYKMSLHRPLSLAVPGTHLANWKNRQPMPSGGLSGLFPTVQPGSLETQPPPI